jgi:membrane protein YdbS with pleckstrin-like domain
MKSFSLFTNTQYTFEGEYPYERVVALLFRHWFVLFIKVLAYVLLFLIPPAIYLFGGSFLSEYSLGSLFALLITVYYMAWWYGIFYAIAMYLLDTWIITNHRVIDSEQHGFFNRTVAELTLSKIQDVGTRVEGPLATWLKFGNLDIQTAGTNPKFSFKQTPDPVKVKDLLMRARNEYVAEHPGDVEVHEQPSLPHNTVT